MLEHLATVRDQVTDVVSEITTEELGRLIGNRHQASDAAMRTIWHTMAHVRQIWLLRGALDITDGEWWPRQHWA